MMHRGRGLEVLAWCCRVLPVLVWRVLLPVCLLVLLALVLARWTSARLAWTMIVALGWVLAVLDWMTVRDTILCPSPVHSVLTVSSFVAAPECHQHQTLLLLLLFLKTLLSATRRGVQEGVG